MLSVLAEGVTTLLFHLRSPLRLARIVPLIMIVLNWYLLSCSNLSPGPWLLTERHSYDVKIRQNKAIKAFCNLNDQRPENFTIVLRLYNKREKWLTSYRLLGKIGSTAEFCIFHGDHIKCSQGRTHTLYHKNHDSDAVKIVASSNGTHWLGISSDLTVNLDSNTAGQIIARAEMSFHPWYLLSFCYIQNEHGKIVTSSTP